jgi:cell division protein FtsN
MSRNIKNGQKRSQGQSGHPMVVGVFIGVLVGLCLALGVALYLNKTPTPFVAKESDKSAATKPGVKFEPAKPDKTESAKGPSQAPGKPPEAKPRLDFYTILPGKEEVVPDKDVSKSTASGSASRVVYYLQAGAFQAATDADNLKARLALAGLEAQIQTATLPDNSIWHRVRLGPYTNAQDLEKARAALKENKIDNAVIKVNEPLAKR